MVLAPPIPAFVFPAAAFSLLLLLFFVPFSADLPASYRGWLMWWMIASFLVHLLVGVMITFTPALAYMGPDALTYHAEAALLADQLRGSAGELVLSVGKEGFYYSLGALYAAFGNHIVAGLVMNAAFAAALVPVMTDATRRLCGVRCTRIVPLVVTLFPSFLIWPAQLLREAGVLLLLALTLNAATRLVERIQISWIMTFVVGAALLMTFRASVGLVAVGGLVVALGLAARSLVVGVGIQLSALILLSVMVLGVGIGYAGFAVTAGADLQDVDAFRSAVSAKAESGIAPEARLATPADAARFLPSAIARFLLGPFPWEIRSPQQAAGLVDVIPWWVLIPSLVSGVVGGWRLLGRKLALLVLPAGGVLILLALAAGNYGLLLRERTQFVLLLVPLIALGAMRRHPWTSWPSSVAVSDSDLEVAEYRAS